MILLLSIGVGVMAAGGIFLLLRFSLVHSLFGITLLGNAVNLAILTLGGLKSGAEAPIMNDGAQTLGSTAMDPLPQALVLTAIVIGFGMLAYLSVLLKVSRDSFQNHDEIDEGEGR